jgi:hypothetical protein
VSFRERTTENGKILREDIDDLTVNGTITGNYTIAGLFLVLHPEIG